VAKHGIIVFRLFGWTFTSDLNFRNTECWKLSSERCIVGGQRSGGQKARLPKAGGLRRKLDLFLFNPKAVAIVGLFFVLLARLLNFPVSNTASIYSYIHLNVCMDRNTEQQEACTRWHVKRVQKVVLGMTSLTLTSRITAIANSMREQSF
jgi:hypothetical protein